MKTTTTLLILSLFFTGCVNSSNLNEKITCSNYQDVIDEFINDMNSRHPIEGQEELTSLEESVFYSPVLDSCLYAYNYMILETSEEDHLYKSFYLVDAVEDIIIENTSYDSTKDASLEEVYKNFQNIIKSYK